MIRKQMIITTYCPDMHLQPEVIGAARACEGCSQWPKAVGAYQGNKYFITCHTPTCCIAKCSSWWDKCFSVVYITTSIEKMPKNGKQIRLFSISQFFSIVTVTNHDVTVVKIRATGLSYQPWFLNETPWHLRGQNQGSQKACDKVGIPDTIVSHRLLFTSLCWSRVWSHGEVMV